MICNLTDLIFDLVRLFSLFLSSISSLKLGLFLHRVVLFVDRGSIKRLIRKSRLRNELKLILYCCSIVRGGIANDNPFLLALYFNNAFRRKLLVLCLLRRRIYGKAIVGMLIFNSHLTVERSPVKLRAIARWLVKLHPIDRLKLLLPFT